MSLVRLSYPLYHRIVGRETVFPTNPNILAGMEVTGTSLSRYAYVRYLDGFDLPPGVSSFGSLVEQKLTSLSAQWYGCSEPIYGGAIGSRRLLVRVPDPMDNDRWERLVMLGLSCDRTFVVESVEYPTGRGSCVLSWVARTQAAILRCGGTRFGKWFEARLAPGLSVDVEYRDCGSRPSLDPNNKVCVVTMVCDDEVWEHLSGIYPEAVLLEDGSRVVTFEGSSASSSVSRCWRLFDKAVADVVLSGFYDTVF